MMQRKDYLVEEFETLGDGIHIVEKEYVGQIYVLHIPTEYLTEDEIKQYGTELRVEVNSANKEWLKYAMVIGKLGWAMWGGELKKFAKHIQSSVMTQQIPNNIDMLTGDLFSNNDIKDMYNYIRCRLKYNQDIQNLDKAYSLLNKKQFYESAMILCGIIDSQNIKYQIKNNEIKIHQGWKGFVKVIKKDFGNKLHINGTTQESLSSKQINVKLSEFEVTDLNKDFMSVEIINLCYAVMTLFDEYDWKKYECVLPSSVNRNWLMHGMYSCVDIKKYDCIKLMILLCKLMRVYEYAEKINKNRDGVDEINNL